MTWFAPFTAVDGTIFTAAQFNTFVRDNLAETMAARASVAASLFATEDYNRVAERTAAMQTVATGDHSIATGQAEATQETTYVDLPTIGPSVSVVTGTQALVVMYCGMLNSSGSAAWMSYEVSGATASTAADNRAIQLQSTGGQQIGAVILHNSLTPGLNTFTAKYRITSSGTGLFNRRTLSVQPL